MDTRQFWTSQSVESVSQSRQLINPKRAITNICKNVWNIGEISRYFENFQVHPKSTYSQKTDFKTTIWVKKQDSSTKMLEVKQHQFRDRKVFCFCSKRLENKSNYKLKQKTALGNPREILVTDFEFQGALGNPSDFPVGHLKIQVISGCDALKWWYENGVSIALWIPAQVNCCNRARWNFRLQIAFG